MAGAVTPRIPTAFITLATKERRSPKLVEEGQGFQKLPHLSQGQGRIYHHPTWRQDPLCYTYSTQSWDMGPSSTKWTAWNWENEISPSIWASVDIRFKVWPTEGLEQERSQFHVIYGCCTSTAQTRTILVMCTCQLPTCGHIVFQAMSGHHTFSCEGKPWVLWICSSKKTPTNLGQSSNIFRNI